MTKRTDVGYGRPPAEHQFKKGQKRPARKAKSNADEDPADLFWRVLQEPRRVEIKGQAGWRKTSELLVMRAFAEAEKGRSSLQRLLNEHLLEGAEGEQEPEVTLALEQEDGTWLRFPQNPQPKQQDSS